MQFSTIHFQLQMIQFSVNKNLFRNQSIDVEEKKDVWGKVIFHRMNFIEINKIFTLQKRLGLMIANQYNTAGIVCYQTAQDFFFFLLTKVESISAPDVSVSIELTFFLIKPSHWML